MLVGLPHIGRSACNASRMVLFPAHVPTLIIREGSGAIKRPYAGSIQSR
jgi:hypothetical protein